ncbi:hypothetical protein [Neptuniibacter sp. QD37_11]|uniref:hypothetical protein n=1 Tax=Neptuniibacter sp. QD37_11 TaxID=3398209 RepID=UPI0039F56528
MHIINISSLSVADLNNLVANYRQAAFDRNEKPQKLNQSRNEVAKMFGARCWDSLVAAAGKSEPNEVWVAVREVTHSESSFTESFTGSSREDLFDKVCNFCQENVAEDIDEGYLFEGVETIHDELSAIDLEPERIAELTYHIQRLNGGEISTEVLLKKLTSEEIALLYFEQHSDEEKLTVRRDK